MNDKREDDEKGTESTNLKSTSTSTATDSDSSSQEGLENTIQVISEFIVTPFEHFIFRWHNGFNSTFFLKDS